MYLCLTLPYLQEKTCTFDELKIELKILNKPDLSLKVFSY